MNNKNNTSKYIGVTVLLILANVAIGVVTNLASDRIPIWFEFYSWPLLIFVTLLLIIFTLYQLRNSTITEDINNQTSLSQMQYSVDNIIDTTAYPTWHMEVDMEHFYGREQELIILKQWTIVDCCRIIAVVGLGGIGKTTLAAHLVDQVYDQFDQVIWRSMRNAPPLTDLLTEYFQVLSQYHSGILPEKLEDRLRLLVQILTERPILIILDNFESILEQEKRAGEYRAEYMDFRLLLDHVAKTQHQSTFLITSREKPREVALHEGENTPVRSLQLAGLDRKSGRQLLHDKGLIGTNAEQINLVEHYQGNPLALKIVGSVVRDSFAGRINSFLNLSTKMVNDINTILNEQFSRLFPLERSILYWLAITRESMTVEMMSYYLIAEFSQSDLIEALASLQRRSLIEINQRQITYTLQNVVMEFVTEQLVMRLTQEIISGDIHLFSSHSILIAQAKEYLRHSQVRLITRPLSEQLLQKVGKVGLASRMSALLDSLRDRANGQDYAVGNFTNLLIQLGLPLSHLDFSNLTIRQAYLQDTILRDVNFVNTNFVDCVFHQAFGGALSIAFSADGRLMAVGNTVGEIHIWEVINFRRMSTLDGHTDWVFSLVFSPDNNLLASGNNDHTVRLWDIANGRCIRVLEGHTNRVYGIDFSVDGHHIVSASNDHSIRIWNVSTGQCLRSLEGHTGRVYSTAFSSDGNFIASAGEDKNVFLWSLETGQLLAIFSGHTHTVRKVLFSSSNEILASAGEDNTIRLWEVSTGICIHELKGHTNYVLSIAFIHGSSLIVSAGSDHTIRIWNVVTGICERILYGHTDTIRSISVHPENGLLASVSDDQTLRLWGLADGFCHQLLHSYTNSITSVSFSPNGNILLSSGEDKIISCWDVESGVCFRGLIGHTGDVRQTTFNGIDDNLVISGSSDHTVRVWNLDTGECIRILKGHTSYIYTIATSNDGELIASGGYDYTIRIWDTKTGNCIYILTGHTDQIWSLAFSPDARILASAGDDRRVRLWDIKTGECITVFDESKNAITSLMFDPNGSIIANGDDDGTIQLIDAISGENHRTLRGHTSTLTSLAYSPDGSVIISGSKDRTIRLWNVQSGKCLKVLNGHTARVRSVTFRNDNRTVASSSDDGTIRLWDSETGECIRTMWPDRPYERSDITGVIGLNDAQKATLKALGAIERTL